MLWFDILMEEGNRRIIIESFVSISLEHVLTKLKTRLWLVQATFAKSTVSWERSIRNRTEIGTIQLRKQAEPWKFRYVSEFVRSRVNRFIVAYWRHIRCQLTLKWNIEKLTENTTAWMILTLAEETKTCAWDFDKCSISFTRFPGSDFATVCKLR